MTESERPRPFGPALEGDPRAALRGLIAHSARMATFGSMRVARRAGM
jgi:hypothetical protein